MLNRTEPGPKARILEECNILASIQLPRNTFFNTQQKTYILVLEKRHTEVDPRPDVFCAIARTIGETLDWQRVPTPDKNDLRDIAHQWVEYTNGNSTQTLTNPLIKIASATQFDKDNRWDVLRFWSDEELVTLGEKEPPIERIVFISEVKDSLDQLSKELSEASRELQSLISTSMIPVSLSDTIFFKVSSGTRITGAQIRENPGEIPVYSCFKNEYIEKGRISEDWLKKHNILLQQHPCVTVNANGASVGRVFVRKPGCVMTDDVIVVDVLSPGIDLDFLAVQLRSAVAAGGFLYEAKLFAGRVKELEVGLPIKEDETLDLNQQRVISSAIRRFDGIRQKIAELGQYSENARIS